MYSSNGWRAVAGNREREISRKEVLHQKPRELWSLNFLLSSYETPPVAATNAFQKEHLLLRGTF